MGALLFIAPILAFDLWLALTTGREQWAKWRATKAWKAVALTAFAGILLAVFCAFIIEFKNGVAVRLKGFPVPYEFWYLEDKRWVISTAQPALLLLARVTDFVTGLVAPLIVFKVADFLRKVREEIK